MGIPMSPSDASHSAGPISNQDVPESEQYPGYRSRRAIKSCLECRRRKMRCSRTQPCQICSRFSRKCVYMPSPKRVDPHLPNEYNPARSITKREELDYPNYNFPDKERETWSESPVQEQISVGAPPSMALNQDSYDWGNVGNEISQPLRSRILRIADRMSWPTRPRLMYEVLDDLHKNHEFVPPRALELTFSVQSSDVDHSLSFETDLVHLNCKPSMVSNASSPSSLPILDDDCRNYLPSAYEANILCQLYFIAVDPVAHIIHKPSFDYQCHKLALYSGGELKTYPASFRALVLAMCFAARTSVSATDCEMRLGPQKGDLLRDLRAATELALEDANYLGTTDLQTIQAFTIYLTSHCREASSESNARLVGTLIRLAEGAGLHRREEDGKLTVVEAQLRRLLWHQICALDLPLVYGHKIEPRIRTHSALPANINDVDLENPHKAAHNAKAWTDATLSLMQYECNMVLRLIINHQNLIEDCNTRNESLRRRVDEQRKRIKEKYLDNLDTDIPIQFCAKILGRILLTNIDVLMIYRSLRQEKNATMQRDLRDCLTMLSLQISENAAILEGHPELAPWSWYARPFQRHPATLLLIKVYVNPYIPCAGRINAILDHLFGSSPQVDSRERNRNLLEFYISEAQGYIERRRGQSVMQAAGDGISEGRLMEQMHINPTALAPHTATTQWPPIDPSLENLAPIASSYLTQHKSQKPSKWLKCPPERPWFESKGILAPSSAGAPKSGNWWKDYVHTHPSVV